MTETRTQTHEDTIAKERAAGIIRTFRSAFPSRGANRHLFDGYLNRIARRVGSFELDSDEDGIMVFVIPHSLSLIELTSDYIEWEWDTPKGPSTQITERYVEFSFDGSRRTQLELGKKIGTDEKIAIIGDNTTAQLIENGVERQATLEEINSLFPKPK